MNNSFQKWFNSKLEKFQAIESYQVGDSVETIAKRIGIPASEIIKLDFNENLFLPREKQVALMKRLAEESDLRLYPQDEDAKLRLALSGYLKTSPECFVIGNASDELLDRVFRLFVEKGDCALSFAPTFSMPQLDVKRQGGQFLTVPLTKDWQLDVEGMLKAFSEKIRVLYLCSPNSPTANQFKASEVETLIQEFSGLVILDEAYCEFADYSFVPKVNEFDNLVIMRTFSKAFGLAALRLGYAVANPKLAGLLTQKTPLPFPVSAFSMNMGRKLLENVDIMKKSVDEVKKERAKLIPNLNKVSGVQAFDSQANFLFMNTQKPCDEVNQKLIKKGILLKKIGRAVYYDNCFRVTVGLPEMNVKLIEVLKQIGEE